MRPFPLARRPVRQHGAVLIAMALALAGCSRPDDADAPAAAPASAPSPGASGSLSAPSSPAWAAEAIRGLCRIRPLQLVQLKADTRGRVREVMVQPGDTVKAGQVLALLDMEEQEVEQRRLRNSLQALQERMRLAQHQLDSASSDWQAVRPLYKQDEATPIKPKEWVRVEERRSEVKQLSLQEEDLRLQLLKLDKALAKAVLRSPIDGQVLTRQVEVGNVVGSALDSGNGRDSLFEIADTGALRAECAVREADAFELRQGQAVQLVAGQKAPPIALTLTQLSPVISQDQGSVRKLWLDIPRAQAAQLTVGMSATAYFTQTAKELE